MYKRQLMNSRMLSSDVSAGFDPNFASAFEAKNSACLLYTSLVICIGRQYGSGGREIGEKLAERLGITCYDKLLLKQAAQKSGVSEKEFERLDEKPVGAGQFLSGNVFADSASIGSTFYSESQIIYDVEQETILKAVSYTHLVLLTNI